MFFQTRRLDVYLQACMEVASAPRVVTRPTFPRGRSVQSILLDIEGRSNGETQKGKKGRIKVPAYTWFTALTSKHYIVIEVPFFCSTAAVRNSLLCRVVRVCVRELWKYFFPVIRLHLEEMAGL